MTNRERKYHAAKRQRRRGYYCPFPEDFRMGGPIVVQRSDGSIHAIMDGEIPDQAALISMLPIPEHWRGEPFSSPPHMAIMLPGNMGADLPIPAIEFYEDAARRFAHVVRAAKPPGRMWNYEALVELAKKRYPEMPVVDAITKCLEDVSGGALSIENMPVQGIVSMDFQVLKNELWQQLLKETEVPAEYLGSLFIGEIPRSVELNFDAQSPLVNEIEEEYKRWSDDNKGNE